MVELEGWWTQMNIGFLVLDFVAPFCNSLKDKRMIVRSLRDKLTKRFNVAFAEVGEQDKYQRILIALVTIANTPERVHEVLDQAQAFAEANAKGAELLSAEREML